MKLHQLSVFLENRPGQLSIPCRALAQAGINIVTLSLADTQQFGILRLVLPDWRKAKAVLEQAGCVVNVTEVVAIDVPDRPGGMADVLEVIERRQINIEYMYAFTSRCGEKAVVIFRFDNPDEALKMLGEEGVNVVRESELFQLIDVK